ncbi:hypothetical protein [Pseudomonas syringae]|uniref:hypothetical protein n=1 Tax=Pseudomonas syringae TaxID=317 RepID=UPI00020987FB|nr:hypothetical protein [Pseudomonas syringae]EGH71541.1 trifunctional transcriptional regulator/proline dehydrogenase/pyrroline-5-carboxylate dehydrogenase [Pseudomonas syringae pv. aceris str. M302273]
MSLSTLGVKFDTDSRERLKATADLLDRSPHWVMKTAIMLMVERVEHGASLIDILGAENALVDDLKYSVSLRRKQQD